MLSSGGPVASLWYIFLIDGGWGGVGGVLQFTSGSVLKLAGSSGHCKEADQEIHKEQASKQHSSPVSAWVPALSSYRGIPQWWACKQR